MSTNVPRGTSETLEQASARAQAELARLLAIVSERRAKMATVEPKRRGGRAA
jgi:hypothetical protein